MSSLERVIYNILSSNNIIFQQEKVFSDFRYGTYRYDFYLVSQNIIIEVNGEQHYQSISKFYKNRSEFLKAQERDRRKISYCLSKKIPIYIIPYWEISSINMLSDIFQSKFLATDKFHNDNVWSKYKSGR